MLEYTNKDPQIVVDTIQAAGIDTSNVAVLSDLNFPAEKGIADHVWIECADAAKLQSIKSVVDAMTQ